MKYIQAENYLCFAALLEMILGDVGVGYTRFEIAENLGVTLPLRAKGRLKGAEYSNNEFEWGIKVDSGKLNEFFRKNKINLHAEYIHTTPYTMLEEKIKKWNQCYVIFLFSYGELIGNSELQEMGHAMLFINMVDSQNIRVYDPGPNDCGEKVINCYRLEEAMYRRRAGYVILHKI